MKAFPVAMFEDQNWLIHTYEKLRNKKNTFGGSFFSILILSFFLFLTPIADNHEGSIILLKFGIFLLFILSTIGWYIKSMEYYKFCIKFLNFEYRQNRFPRKITYEITKFSTAQITFYILMAFIIPVLLSLFFDEIFDLTYLYWGFGAFAVFVVFLFLLKIEDFYEKRDRLEELEILSEAIIYHDPLDVLRGRGHYQSADEAIVHDQQKRKHRLAAASFKKEEEED